ncbi:MAG: outer membrane protein assembly factor BamA [Spirochaetia bacterium]|jgi:outer membrane protein insertion porin family
MNRATKMLFATAVLTAFLAAPLTAQDQGGTNPGSEQPAPGLTQPSAGPTVPQDQAPGQQGPGQSQQGAAQEWYVGKPIKDFTFSGLMTIKADVLKPILAPYIGQTFTVDPLLWEIEGKLYALDYFETIVPNASPADDSKSAVIIQFDVKERPVITSIDVIGNSGIRTGDITDKILLKKGDLANQTKMQADVEAVRSLYLEKGYSNADVKANFVPSDKDNTVRAVFTINEGLATTIKEVRFSGNHFASESTLRGLMKTKPPSLFDAGTFQESKLEDDKAAIGAYYTDHGFIDAKVDKVTQDVVKQEGKNFLILTIYVTEGDQWTYGGLSIEGNQIFGTKRLMELVTQKPGKTLSLQKLQADIGRIQDLYYESGYIFNTFERKENRDNAAKTISYTLTVGEMDKAHIESIIFKGNSKTKEWVLRRELPFEEGEVFNKEKIIEGYRNLVNLQYFKSVQPDTPQGSAFGLMNVVFNVEDASTADINFGITFSGAQQLGDFPISGVIKWNERDFLGRGETVGVDLEASPIKQIISLNFQEPWLLSQRWSVGMSLSFDHSNEQNVLMDMLPPVFSDGDSPNAAPDPYTSRQDYINALEAGLSIPPQYLMRYDAYDIVLGLSTGYKFATPLGFLGFTGSYSPSLRYIHYDDSLYRPFEVTVRSNNNSWNLIDAVTAGAYLDGRDIFWNPTKGYYVGQSFTYTGGFILGFRDYIRSDSTLEGFATLLNVPIAESWSLMFVLAAHSGLSMILPNYGYNPYTGQWGMYTLTDDTDLLYIDGMTVGRGWRVLYGNALWDNKLELRMPLAKDYVWLVGFFDAAALWPDVNLIGGNLNNYYFSYGLGFRFVIPQFPIRVYLARDFKVDNQGNVTYQPGDFSIGSWGLKFVISLGGGTMF